MLYLILSGNDIWIINPKSLYFQWHLNINCLTLPCRPISRLLPLTPSTFQRYFYDLDWLQNCRYYGVQFLQTRLCYYQVYNALPWWHQSFIFIILVQFTSLYYPALTGSGTDGVELVGARPPEARKSQCFPLRCSVRASQAEYRDIGIACVSTIDRGPASILA